MELYSFLYLLALELTALISVPIVSVSLWSYIHSYIENSLHLLENIEIQVSVSLWSYIHSYPIGNLNPSVDISLTVSVSLWSYIHSY